MQLRQLPLTQYTRIVDTNIVSTINKQAYKQFFLLLKIYFYYDTTKDFPKYALEISTPTITQQ